MTALLGVLAALVWIVPFYLLTGWTLTNSWQAWVILLVMLAHDFLFFAYQQRRDSE